MSKGFLIVAGVLCVVVVPGVVFFQSGCGNERITVRYEKPEDADVISTARLFWYPASPPVDPENGSSVLSDDLHAKIFWYNIEPSYGAHRRDFDPRLDERDNDLVSTLDIELESAPAASGTWTGVMRGFAPPFFSPLDLTERLYLEIWVNDFKPDPNDRGGTLYIDVGRIDENFFDPETDHWNDEDRDNDGFNACMDDSGLDEKHNILPDCRRRFYPDDPDEGGRSEYDDLHGDDYSPYRIVGRFSKVNGTERNGRYDTEDLDRSGTMDRTNSFYRFAIDLASQPVLDVRAEYPDYDGFGDEGHERDSWRWYRIALPAGEPVTQGPSPEPDLTDIRHLRIWIRDAGEVMHQGTWGTYRLQIAGLKFTSRAIPAR
jgi:hypothetical protein